MSRCRHHQLSEYQLSVLDQEISAVGSLWSMEGMEYMNHGVCFVTSVLYFAQQLVLLSNYDIDVVAMCVVSVSFQWEKSARSLQVFHVDLPACMLELAPP